MALRGPLMIAANPAAGVTSLKELTAARQTPLSVATAGNGSIGHLATELLKEVTGLSIIHVPYRGGGPALNDALGGQVSTIFDTAAALLPHVKAGKLRALAVTGAQPYAPLPEIPTVKQALGKDFEAYSWFGLVAPKGVPDVAMQKLSAAFAKAAESQKVKGQLAQQGLEAGVATAREFASVISADFRRWSGLITRAKIQPE